MDIAGTEAGASADVEAEAGARAEEAAPEETDATGVGGEEAQANASWWEVIYGNTVEGAGRTIELDMALQAFVAAVETNGAKDDGQLAKQLSDLGGQEG